MKIGFIGAGNMGEALLSGMIKGGLLSPDDIVVFDPNDDKILEISKKYKIKVAQDNQDLLNHVNSFILAIKPNIYPRVLSEIYEYLTPNHHLISLAPGYNFSKIKDLINNTDCLISLIMSNTSAAIGQGVTAACFDPKITEENKSELINIFQSLGSFIEVEETQMPTITSVIGSTPAIVYMLIEGMMQGAILEGLPAEQAKQLVAHVVASAANMVIKTDEHPSILRDRICSPGGTTIEGVSHLKSIGFEGKVIDAIRIMAEKARKM